jgi:hypothetical protein
LFPCIDAAAEVTNILQSHFLHPLHRKGRASAPSSVEDKLFARGKDRFVHGASRVNCKL